MPDTEWITVTWKEIEQKDYVRKSEAATIFRVEAKDGETLTLFNPKSTQTGKPNPDGQVQVRTKKNGQISEAGYRFEYLADEKIKLLKDKLDAEMYALRLGVPENSAFVPWILTENYTPSTLSSHLFIAHGMFIGEPPKTAELKRELKVTHDEEHARQYRFDGGRNLPHIHNEQAFREAFK